MKLAKFKIEITPPEGCPVALSVEPAGIRDPLFMRGIILDDKDTKVVIASLDFCALMNKAHDSLVNALASGSGTDPGNVIVHCIHQHDAPLVNFEAEALYGRIQYPESWWNSIQEKCRTAAAEAIKETEEITAIGHAATKISGYASNRRILGEDGKIVTTRWSRSSDPAIKNLPEGIIDPSLKTVAFRNSKGIITASMSFYATHPQVSNNGKAFSGDAPGEAMSLLESRHKTSLPCFFTGAGGNVTAGKYSSDSDLEWNLSHFGKLLADGITKNLNSLKWSENTALELCQEEFEFPRMDLDIEELKSEIKDPSTDIVKKARNAAILASAAYSGNRYYRLNLLKTGDIKILFLPGEPFVEYQLYAQSAAPGEFVALAANCSDGFLYIPLAKSFEEGGYEPDYFCWCTPDIEKKLKTALKKLVMS